MANLTRLSVLIAEPDLERSREIAALLQELGVQRIVHAESRGALLEALGKHAFDVLMCAERMGDDEGVAVLRAVRDAAPATRTVLMRTNDRAGEFVPEDVEAIELPFSRLTLQGLLHRTAAPQGGLWCEVPQLSLSDILQMYHQAKRSITVLLSGPIGGRIRLDAGEIVDAEANQERGMSALSRLLEAEFGLVRTESARSSGPRTISAPFQRVLLEAAQKLDERRRDSLAGPVMSSPVMSSPVMSSPVTSSPVMSSPVTSGPLTSSHGHDPLGHDFIERDLTGHDLTGHDLGRHERSSVSSDLSRRAMTPMLQAHAPSTESFLAPQRARGRRAVLAVISVLAALVFVAVAASYLGERLEEERARTAPGNVEPTPAEPVTAIDARSPALAPPRTEQALVDDRAGGQPAEDSPGAARDVSSPRATHPLTTPDAHAAGVAKPVAPPIAERAPVRSSSFALHITSRPSRATVFEAGRMLGKTPLTVTIGASSVANSSREFVLRLPGYFSARIDQGASASDVTAGVVLMPNPVVADIPDGGAAEFESDTVAGRPGNPRPRRKDLGIRLRR